MFDLKRDSQTERKSRPHPAPGPVRCATPRDLPEVMALLNLAKQVMQDRGIDQWDDVYPDERTIQQDLNAHSLYVSPLHGAIASVFVLNQQCDPAYAQGNWTHRGPFGVVHRLCVHPDCQQAGMGTRSMAAAEAILKSQGMAAVRLDAFSQNPAALRLYQKLGYQNAGSVTFRKGVFHLFEKML